MSDTYSTQTEPPNVTVNVAPPPQAAAPVPMATDADVARFLGAASATPPSGSTIDPNAYHQDPTGGDFITGAAKGFGQGVLGAASLLTTPFPWANKYVNRESWLGQRAYAPSRNISESAGEFAGSFIPIAGIGRGINAIRLGPQVIDRIRTTMSPGLANVAREIFGSASATRGTWANPVGSGGLGRIAVRANQPRVIAAKTAIAGTAAGAIQEPPKGGSRLENAILGGLTGGATGLAVPQAARVSQTIARAMASAGVTPTTQQAQGVGHVINLLSTAGLGVMLGHPIMGVAAFSLLHGLGLGVRASHALAPGVAAAAAALRAMGPYAPTAGAAIGSTVAEVAGDVSRQGPR